MAGPDHPMRKVTREVAFEGGWSPGRAAKVAELFDALAETWHERESVERVEPLRDALDRGSVKSGTCVEVGSGTGHGTAVLADYFERVLAVDLSREMLRRAPREPGHRIRADAASLPLPAASAACVVLVNALLFPAELSRVLQGDGAVVWVNSLGDRTPIHLPVEDVARALPGAWSGVASEAGWGTWCVLRRANG